MNFVRTLPVATLKVGSVFYAEGTGYAVVVKLDEKLGKASTVYGRPIVLLKNEEGTGYNVYPQSTRADGEDAPLNAVTLGPVCERVEFEESNKMLGVTLAENWESQLGKNALEKLEKQLVEALNTQLHTSQLTMEERTWGNAVCDFREKQKPLRVNGKLFKPKLSRFICGFEKDGQRSLFFVKKITNMIYRVTQDLTLEDGPYLVEECNDDEVKLELMDAVRERLIPMAAYDFLFGKSSERTSQVSAMIPVELHERMKWGGFSLPQVIQAGIQALEDDETLLTMILESASVPNVISGTMLEDGRHNLLRMILLNEDNI